LNYLNSKSRGIRIVSTRRQYFLASALCLGTTLLMACSGGGGTTASAAANADGKADYSTEGTLCCSAAQRPNLEVAARVVRAAAAGNEAALGPDLGGVSAKQVIWALSGHGSLSKLSFDLAYDDATTDNASNKVPRDIVHGSAIFSDGARLRFEAREELRGGKWVVTDFTVTARGKV